MWSVWSESVDIYLGQGIAMFKTKHKEAQVMQHPATLPLERVLTNLAEALALDSAGQKPKRRTLRISLSGALCPAIGFNLPQTVACWHEQREIACASAAAVLASSTDRIFCETDATRPGVAAAMAAPVMAELQSWAAVQNYRISSIRPLWAVATQSQLARQSEVHGLLVQEPDSVTVVADDGQGRLIATTLAGGSEHASVQIHARRWLVSLGLNEDKLLKLTFSTQLHALIPQGPNVWPPHWSKS